MDIAKIIDSELKGVEYVKRIPLFSRVHRFTPILSQDVEPYTINGIFEFLIKRLFL